MLQVDKPGKTVILNGTPRSGKSSIATVIQNEFEGVWMNLGGDRFMRMTPKRYQPGIGLQPDLEPLVMVMYQAMYETIALYSRLGLSVVVDVGHHDGYSVPLGILSNCARILSGLPVLFVGVHCPIEIVIERRLNTGMLVTPLMAWCQNQLVYGSSLSMCLVFMT